MTDRVDLQIIDYRRQPRDRGLYQMFFSVPGEKDEQGKKRFREIVQGPSIKAILDEIGPEIGTNDRPPKPTHVHGVAIAEDADLFTAIMQSRDLWL